MTQEEFAIISSYPLDIKVAKTKQRIREAVERFGLDGVYVSFSGGKDSTVLLDIARSIYPDMLAVYCDTGLEYPEVKEFVRSINNVEIIKPKKNFKQILSEYGYPVISKEQAQFIDDLRHAKSQKTIDLRLYGNKNGNFKIAQKWRYLLNEPFRISHRCCYHMKKSPFKSFNHKTGKVPILGTRATESKLRMTTYLNTGCNIFDTKNPKSQPLSFWTEQDILNYLVEHNLKIPDVYGEIVETTEQKSFIAETDKPVLKCTGVDRTGCIFCGFGCHIEKTPNRYQRLKETHPNLYDYVINGGEFVDGWWQPNSKGLGFGKILDLLHVQY